MTDFCKASAFYAEFEKMNESCGEITGADCQHTELKKKKTIQSNRYTVVGRMLCY